MRLFCFNTLLCHCVLYGSDLFKLIKAKSLHAYFTFHGKLLSETIRTESDSTIRRRRAISMIIFDGQNCIIDTLRCKLIPRLLNICMPC